MATNSLNGQKSRISNPRYNESRGNSKAFKSVRSKNAAAMARRKSRQHQQFTRQFAAGAVKR